ncbi:hypothetical protein BS330_31115 [Amycolatopsis keratiniphila subsp. nogabecina]|nr:hypothetical protein BS330_31115 [Amycolatopsis keratiniphila subsp. nogabecina]
MDDSRVWMDDTCVWTDDSRRRLRRGRVVHPDTCVVRLITRVVRSITRSRRSVQVVVSGDSG